MILSSTFRVLSCRSSLVLLWCCLGFGMLPLTSTFGQDEEADVGRTDNKPARSVVRGRVIFADSEQPLRRATLRLRKDFNRDFLKRTISGKGGEFSFQGVPAGTYYVDVQAPGIVSPGNGVSFTNLGFSIEESSLNQVTVDGTSDVQTEIRVIRGGAISGRISYSDGEPATHARIVLYRQKGQTPALFFTDAALFADDRGIYRIEGLPSGQYFVGAVENHSGGERTLPRDGAGLVTAYHPAATSVRGATMVNVQAGSEARDVNIKFAEEPRRLSGTVKWKQSDSAVKHATVFLRRIADPQMDLDHEQFLRMVTPLGGIDNDDLMMRDMFFLSLLSANSPYVEADDNGHWSFLDVPEGTYSVSVEAPLPVDEPVKPKSSKEPIDDLIADLNVGLPDFSKGLARGSAEVTIKDKNVDDLLIDLSEGASIAGSVMIEGDSSDAPAVAVNVVSGGTQSLFNLPAYVKKDRTFVLESVPAGAVRLDISEPRGAHYYIRSITGKGLNLLNEPLTLTEGERVTGVQIVLGSDLATVEGQVVATPGGRSIAGAGVLLLPVDQRMWNTRSTWGLARADAEGKFSMRLAPGEYLAVAWSLANEPSVPLESYVREHLATARRITLLQGETKTLEMQASANSMETPRPNLVLPDAQGNSASKHLLEKYSNTIIQQKKRPLRNGL